jgi:VWFA-related protein
MRWMKCSPTTAKWDSLRRIATFLLASALLGSRALTQNAQQPQTTQQPGPEAAPATTLRAQSNLVLIPALVKDPRGSVVYGLQAKDFLAEDDGVEQLVRLDEAPEGQPISLVVALQRGRRADYEFPRMLGLKSMLSPLFGLGTARVAVVEFDSQVYLTRNFTRDETQVSGDLTNLQPGDDGAAILDAVRYSVDLLQQEPEERLRILLLISETRDHGSIAKIDDTIAAIGQSNAVMYALAFSPALSNILDTERGNNISEMHNGVNFLDLGYRVAQAMRKNVPSTIASMTGGEYELFATRKKFEARMNEFTNHLHSRYLLSFAPRNPHPGLHQIQVRLRPSLNASGNETVLARTSYFAQGAK